MGHLPRFVLGLVATTAALLWPLPGLAQAPEHDPHTLIIKLAPQIDGKVLAHGGLAKDALAAGLRSAGVDSIRPLFAIPPGGVRNPRAYDSLGLGQFFACFLGSNRLAADALVDLSQSPDIEGAGLNHRVQACEASAVPTDPLYPLQWHLAQVDLPLAWNITTGSPSVLVGVIDTGIDYAHPDLESRVAVNIDEFFGTFWEDDDLNGYTDDIYGYDYVNDDGFAYDDEGHGTHVAGTVGAVPNNGQQGSGVDWGCLLYPIKILNPSGLGWEIDLGRAILYATDMNCRVINLSLKWPQTSYINSAIAYAHSSGTALIVAMGNSNSDTLNFPAISPLVMAVGATDTLDQRWVWNLYQGSDVGQHIDVVAPGDYIWSTVASEDTLATYPFDTKTGTSMAAPHVAGLAALILAARPGLSVDSLYAYICLGADDQVGRPQEDTPGWDMFHGWGRINAYRSLLLATGQMTCDCPLQGDIDGNRFSDATDLAFLIDITFYGGTDYQSPLCPVWRSDFDNNGFTDATDLAFWIDYVFYGAAAPSDPCAP